MTTPVSKIVNVSILSSPTFPARAGFGTLNIMGVASRLPSGDRIRFYSDLAGVAVDFQTTDEEYLAAQKYFGQSPRPNQLAISRRFNTATPAELLGGLAPEKSLTAWNAISNGGFDITIDGVLKQVTAINVSASATLTAVAAAIQTRLQVVAASATVVYDGTRFIIRSGTTGASSTITYAVAPTGAGSPVDISLMLAARSTQFGIVTPGSAVETVSQSVANIYNINQSWYGLMMTTEATEAELKLAAAWTEANGKIFGYTTSASNCLATGDTTNIGYFFKNLLYARTFGVWDNDDKYLAASVFGRAFTVNFNQQNSTITLKFKTMPGNTTSVITESQRLALVANNLNYYTQFGESAMLAEGIMASGIFIDERHGLDWLQNAIETNVFGYLYTRTTKIPQTDAGVATLVQQVEKALAEAVNNGLLAPGQWNGGDLGEMKTGMYLQTGYYVYAQPVAQQNTSDREARKAPPIQAICKGAGAIHFADVTVTFER